MKKVIAITCCLAVLGLSNAFAQTVNDVLVKDIDVDYIQIVGTSRLLSNKVTIELDFGQENKLWSNNMKVKDKDGKGLVFNSMIDALNFLSENGFTFVNAYAFSSGNQNVYHYLMKKNEE